MYASITFVPKPFNTLKQLIMKYISLVDMKFALKQFILANKLGHNHPRRLRRFARKKSVFFKIRMKCDKLIERKMGDLIMKLINH